MDQGILSILGDGTDSGKRALYALVVLLISFVLGGIIGTEREFNGHAAGLRTHIIISVSATMVGIIGIAETTWAPFLFGAVIISLGFLSAGSIIQTGKDVKGITTSSTVWVTGIIGLAVGLSYVLEAIIVTLLSLGVLIILSYVELKTSKRNPTVTLFVDSQTDIGEKIVKTASTYGLKVKNISSKISKFKNEDALKIIVTFDRAPGETVKAFAEELSNSVSPLDLTVRVPRV
ncbi:MAG: MgtC/SapB family protein [Bacilli bacterium]|jgi:putative Mg2+ transporter-C (MgtC) family protein|nr:MgtC/SapB family protein [Bacilli bacterium]